MEWEIFLLFVCIWNGFHYPSTNCSDNLLYPSNNKAFATNCSKTFPSKEFGKIHLLTAPLQIRRGGLSVQRLGAAQGRSLWRNTHSFLLNRGALTTCSLRKLERERCIRQKKRISQYVCNEPGAKHLPFDTSQAATVDFTRFSSSFTSEPSSLWVFFIWFYNLPFLLWGASTGSGCDQSPVPDDSLLNQVQTWKTDLSWKAVKSWNSGVWIVENKRDIAHFSNKCTTEKMGKNHIQSGASSFKGISRSEDLLDQ